LFPQIVLWSVYIKDHLANILCTIES
jgi:hypothetical protein